MRVVDGSEGTLVVAVTTSIEGGLSVLERMMPRWEAAVVDTGGTPGVADAMLDGQSAL